MCQEIVHSALLPPPATWAAHTRQKGSTVHVVHSKFWPQHLVLYGPVEPVLTVRQTYCLHSTVVTCAYLSHCCLNVSFNQSAQSSLTSLINTAFSPTEPPLTGCCFSHHSLSTLDTVVHGDPRGSAVSESNYRFQSTSYFLSLFSAYSFFYRVPQ